MLCLKSTPNNLSCYQTTKILKALIGAHNTCDSSITPDDQQLLKQIALISVKIRDWLNTIELNLQAYSADFSIHDRFSSDSIIEVSRIRLDLVQ